jgi:thiol-disulfide isomerase/thioredoxin
VTGAAAAAVLVPTLAFAQGSAATPAEEAEAAESRPLIVKIHADWCAKCRAIAPTWTRIEEELADEARVVVLEVTDEKRAAEAKRLAEELGIAEFLAAFRARTGTVAIFEPSAASPSEVFIAERTSIPTASRSSRSPRGELTGITAPRRAGRAQVESAPTSTAAAEGTPTESTPAGAVPRPPHRHPAFRLVLPAGLALAVTAGWWWPPGRPLRSSRRPARAPSCSGC